MPEPPEPARQLEGVGLAPPEEDRLGGLQVGGQEQRSQDQVQAAPEPGAGLPEGGWRRSPGTAWWATLAVAALGLYLLAAGSFSTPVGDDTVLVVLPDGRGDLIRLSQPFHSQTDSVLRYGPPSSPVRLLDALDELESRPGYALRGTTRERVLLDLLDLWRLLTLDGAIRRRLASHLGPLDRRAVELLSRPHRGADCWVGPEELRRRIAWLGLDARPSPGPPPAVLASDPLGARASLRTLLEALDQLAGYTSVPDDRRRAWARDLAEALRVREEIREVSWRIWDRLGRERQEAAQVMEDPSHYVPGSVSDAALPGATWHLSSRLLAPPPEVP